MLRKGLLCLENNSRKCGHIFFFLKPYYPLNLLIPDVHHCKTKGRLPGTLGWSFPVDCLIQFKYTALSICDSFFSELAFSSAFVCVCVKSYYFVIFL